MRNKVETSKLIRRWLAPQLVDLVKCEQQADLYRFGRISRNGVGGLAEGVGVLLVVVGRHVVEGEGVVGDI